MAVTDSDTIQVLKDGRDEDQVVWHRFPKKARPFGQKAKHFTSKLAFGKIAKVYSKGLHRYQCVLAWVYVGPKGINQELVGNGLTWL